MWNVFKNGKQIKVHQRGKFLEDPHFRNLIASLKKRVEHLPSAERKEKVMNLDKVLKISTQTDSVFFHPDKFELVIDARGIPPQELKCNITRDVLEVYINPSKVFDNASACRFMNRRYQLPQNIDPLLSTCSLSSEGILYIAAPWSLL